MFENFPMHEFASMTGRDFPVDGNISVSISSTQPISFAAAQPCGITSNATVL